MCLICLELEKLTAIEAINNLREMESTIEDIHFNELSLKLVAKSQAEAVANTDKISSIFHNRENRNKDL